MALLCSKTQAKYTAIYFKVTNDPKGGVEKGNQGFHKNNSFISLVITRKGGPFDSVSSA